MIRAVIAFGLALICTAVGAIAAQAYVTESATIWRLAGNGIVCPTPTGPCGDSGTPGSATAANLKNPEGIALDGAGNVYIADTQNQKIRKVTPAGAISTIAGDGNICPTPTGTCGDGATATAANLTGPSGVAVDGAGNVYIADNANNKIRKVTPAGAISTIAGDGNFCGTLTCGDGGAATAAQINGPTGVAVDGAGNVYIADTGNMKIRKVTGGMISTIAGNGIQCPDPTTSCGDSATPGSATTASLNGPSGVAVDGAGNVYIADQSNQKVRKVTPGGAISTIAGNGTACPTPTTSCGDGPTATTAQLAFPTGVAVDGAGNVYIADQSTFKIRKVMPGGAISTIAGNGTQCANPPVCGDGGAATAASLVSPTGVAVDGAGQNLFVADATSDEIRWIAGPQAGPIGPQGPPGAAGPQGPPGKDATATCKVKQAKGSKVKVKCTVAQAASRSVLSYRLTRGKRVFAAGRRPVKNGKSVATLRARRAIKPGRYTLTLILDSGDQTFVLRQTVRVT